MLPSESDRPAGRRTWGQPRARCEGATVGSSPWAADLMGAEKVILLAPRANPAPRPGFARHSRDAHRRAS
jgi:hypothetical protein